MHNSSLKPRVLLLASLAVAVFTLTAGCGHRAQPHPTPAAPSPTLASQPQVMAPPTIRQSFTISNAPLAQDLKPHPSTLHLSILPSALEKEFLLQANLIPQPEVATGKGLKSRVVAFRKRGSKIFLMEATQGHSITPDLPQNLILAEFPILDESDQGITFDFNTGMSQIFVYSDWHAQDLDGPWYNGDQHFQSLSIRHSYLESAEFNASNQLKIRQIAQAILPGASGNQIAPVEIRYYLSPYRPHPNFRPTRSRSFDRMGFFEVAPQIGPHGTSIVFASKFDSTRPIVFAISSNTPPLFRNAVRDGILYWNKAFGREAIQVIDAPAGVTAPDVHYNLVQWVPWDEAGFAYADAQMDPRSGEITHAQVYLTSAFAWVGRQRARQILQKFKNDEKRSIQRKAMRISLSGFDSTEMCDFEAQDSWIESATDLLSTGASDAQILKASQDYIREVTAHEIGHTLGLRHNFAGSLATNIPPSQRLSIVRQYLSQGSTPENIITTSSVMDYQLFEESILNGDQIAHHPQAMLYDQKAIATLYDGVELNDSEIPYFCTDSHRSTGEFSDCNTFDAGESVVEYAVESALNEIKSIPNTLLESYISAKDPAFGEPPTPFQKVRLPSINGMAVKIFSAHQRLFRNLTSVGKLLRIRRNYPLVDSWNLPRVRTHELEYLSQEFNRMGGLRKVFSILPDQLDRWVLAEFTYQLEQARSGIGPTGKPYSLSDTEMEIARTQVALYAKQLMNDLYKSEIELLSGAPLQKLNAKIVDHELGDQFAEFATMTLEKYVFATTGKTTDLDFEIPATGASQPGKSISVRLPQFSHSLEVRQAAASLLKDGRGESLTWALAERQATQERFNRWMEELLTVPLSSVPISRVPRPVAQWVLENRKVSAAF